MTHPCADHPCDHCYVCDVLGVCCGSVSSRQQACLEADHAQRERLRLAIIGETGTVPCLAALVRADAASVRPLLAAAGQVVLPSGNQFLPFNARKEALYVVSPGTTR